jgi:hypothetical protein
MNVALINVFNVDLSRQQQLVDFARSRHRVAAAVSAVPRLVLRSCRQSLGIRVRQIIGLGVIRPSGVSAA